MNACRFWTLANRVFHTGWLCNRPKRKKATYRKQTCSSRAGNCGFFRFWVLTLDIITIIIIFMYRPPSMIMHGSSPHLCFFLVPHVVFFTATLYGVHAGRQRFDTHAPMFFVATRNCCFAVFRRPYFITVRCSIAPPV